MLPSFPSLTGKLTDERIERTAERLMGVADIALTSGVARPDAYDDWCRRLHIWTGKQYERLSIERRTVTDNQWRQQRADFD